jgi:hypothetical protein
MPPSIRSASSGGIRRHRQVRTIDRFARTEIDMLGTLPDGTIVRNPDELRVALLADPAPFVQNSTSG